MATAPNDLFPWSQKYQVGIGFVDAHHKQLVGIINRLHHAMHAGKDKDVLGKTLEELIHHTKSHFAAEEKVLQSSGFPEFPAHRAEHERLAYTVLEFHQKLMNNEIGLTLNVMDFLKDWLGQHILHVDMKYAPYLKKRGVM
jgi:hemerythrin